METGKWKWMDNENENEKEKENKWNENENEDGNESESEWKWQQLDVLKSEVLVWCQDHNNITLSIYLYSIHATFFFAHPVERSNIFMFHYNVKRTKQLSA